MNPSGFLISGTREEGISMMLLGLGGCIGYFTLVSYTNLPAPPAHRLYG